MISLICPQILFTKLFVVMGLLWVHYLLHSHHQTTECLSSSEFILRAIGCVNLLRGCLIFFIFVCKESTLDKVPTTILPQSYSPAPQMGRVTVCGVRLAFLTRGRATHYDSVASKHTIVNQDDCKRSDVRCLMPVI